MNQVRHVLSAVVNADNSTAIRIININKTLLEKKCPLLVEFLLAGEILMSNKINLLKDILKSVDAPFIDREVHGQHCY